MAIQFINGKFHGFNDDGTPMVGGLLYTYVSGTTTPQATYTDSTLGTPNTNPVVLDSRGEASVWLGTSAYTMKLTTSVGALVWTEDGVIDSSGSFSAALASSANGSGADLVGGVGRVVTNITALRALLKTGVGKAFVLGYYASGDGGGGQYYYDASDTTSADNGGTIIVASDGGRWKLVVTQSVSVRQFGAKGDGTTDDTAAIQAAIAAAREIVVPSGNYLINSGVVIPSATTLKFQKNATFKAGANNLTVISTSGFTSSARVIDANIDGNGHTGVTGIGFSNVQFDSVIERPNIANCATGISLASSCIGVSINHPTTYATPTGINIAYGCNANTVICPNIDNLTGTKAGTGIFTGGSTNKIFGGFIQGFTQAVYDSGSYTGVHGLYVEQCINAAVNCSGSLETSITDLFFYGYNAVASPAYAVVSANSNGVKVLYPNMVQGNSTGGLYYFANGNANCTEIHTSGNGTSNTVLGTATQITPTGATTNQYTPSLVKNGTATTAVAVTLFTFNVTSPNTVTLCEVVLTAQEQTGFVASSTRKFVFALTNSGGTLTASAVASDAASSIDKTTANYVINVGAPSVAIVNSTTATFSITLTTGGAIGWTNCKYTAKASLVSSATASVN